MIRSDVVPEHPQGTSGVGSGCPAPDGVSGCLRCWLGMTGEGRRAHVDLGSEVEPGGSTLGVEIETDALALTEHAEDGTVERVPRGPKKRLKITKIETA